VHVCTIVALEIGTLNSFYLSVSFYVCMKLCYINKIIFCGLGNQDFSLSSLLHFIFLGSSRISYMMSYL